MRVFPSCQWMAFFFEGGGGEMEVEDMLINFWNRRSQIRRSCTCTISSFEWRAPTKGKSLRNCQFSVDPQLTLLASVWDLFSLLGQKLLSENFLGNKQGHPGYSHSFVGKEGLPAVWVSGLLPQISTVAGSLQLEARQPIRPEPLLHSVSILAFTVTFLLAISLWSAFPLTLRTFRGSRASSTNTWGV